MRARMPSVEALLTHIFTTAVPEWRSAVAEAKAAQPAAEQADGAQAPLAGTAGSGFSLITSGYWFLLLRGNGTSMPPAC